jgi:hypothetical protein
MEYSVSTFHKAFQQYSQLLFKEEGADAYIWEWKDTPMVSRKPSVVPHAVHLP